MPTIQCPTCRTLLECSADMIGQPMRCGQCKVMFEARKLSRSSRLRQEELEDDDDDDDFEETVRSAHVRDIQRPPYGFAVTSMIIGIVSLAVALFSGVSFIVGSSCCCPFLSWPFIALAGILAIIGTVFGVMAMTRKQPRGFWIAGLSTSIIAGVIALIIIVLNIFMGFWVAKSIPTATAPPPSPLVFPTSQVPKTPATPKVPPTTFPKPTSVDKVKK